MIPKTTLKFIGLFYCTLLLVSCKKEGCTDETALNYDEKANLNDFSCSYAGDPFIGAYEITDTLYMPMLSEIAAVYQKVTIVGSNSDTFYLTDYRNTNYTLFMVIDGPSFTVPEQEIGGSQMVAGVGLFSNDSLYYVIEGTDYDNRGSRGKF